MRAQGERERQVREAKTGEERREDESEVILNVRVQSLDEVQGRDNICAERAHGVVEKVLVDPVGRRTTLANSKGPTKNVQLKRQRRRQGETEKEREIRCNESTLHLVLHLPPNTGATTTQVAVSESVASEIDNLVSSTGPPWFWSSCVFAE